MEIDWNRKWVIGFKRKKFIMEVIRGKLYASYVNIKSTGETEWFLCIFIWMAKQKSRPNVISHNIIIYCHLVLFEYDWEVQILQFISKYVWKSREREREKKP